MYADSARRDDLNPEIKARLLSKRYGEFAAMLTDHSVEG